MNGKIKMEQNSSEKFQFMKKNIANIITGSRIILSLCLVFIPMFSAWFYVFYFVCGLTDMIDGLVARKVGVASKFGAKLDTIADFMFTLVCSIRILPLIHIPLWLWSWIIIIALIKIFDIAFVFIHRKELLSIHSMLNKLTGLALFIFPLSLTFVEIIYSVVAICVLATIAAMQEVYLIAKGQEVLC